MRAGAASLQRDQIARDASTARLRATLADGAQTTVHVATYPLATTEVRAIFMRRPQPLAAWCEQRAITEALVGGFFLRSAGRPLGEFRMGGIKRRSTPFLAPWDSERACVHVEGRTVRIAARPELPARPRGDLVQAGPLLVRGGHPVVRDGDDPEGFSAGSAQFDTDITDGRHPRAALVIAGDSLLAVVCDGRSAHDSGMTLGEMAAYLVTLGAESAINLDGGGSASLVAGGALVNSPRELEGDPIPGGRPVVTAFAFLPRR